MNQYFDIYLIKGFAKKPNSTKRPDIDLNAETTEKQKRVRGRLRDGCSIFRPEIDIQWDIKPLKTQGGTDYPDPQYRQADISAYNYAYIQLFGDYNTATYGDYFDNVHGRYYYITDIIINSSGLYQLTLQVDVLATYRDDIGGSTQFIMRSEYLRKNYIADDLGAHSDIRSYASASVNIINEGTALRTLYAVVASYDGFGIEGGFALVEDATVFSTRWQWLYTSADGTTRPFTDAEWESFRPMDAVKGAYSIPTSFLPLPKFSTKVSYGAGTAKADLEHGWAVYPVSIGKAVVSRTINVPKHPQKDSYPFVEGGKYSDYTMTIPLCGTFAIDADLLIGVSSLDITVTVDPLNGQGVLKVTNGNRVIYSASVCVASYAAYGYAQSNAAGAAVSQKIANRSANIAAISSAVGALGSAAAGNPVGVIGGVVSAVSAGAQIENNGIRAGIEGAQTTSAGISGGGSRFALFEPCVLSASFITFIPPSGVGSPFYGASKVSDAGGYMTVANPHLDLNANLDEMQAIYRYMEGGFYYE